MVRTPPSSDVRPPAPPARRGGAVEAAAGGEGQGAGARGDRQGAGQRGFLQEARPGQARGGDRQGGGGGLRAATAREAASEARATEGAQAELLEGQRVLRGDALRRAGSRCTRALVRSCAGACAGAKLRDLRSCEAAQSRAKLRRRVRALRWLAVRRIAGARRPTRGDEM
eukprot:5805996-Prymnesium_polylepis.1